MLLLIASHEVRNHLFYHVVKYAKCEKDCSESKTMQNTWMEVVM